MEEKRVKSQEEQDKNNGALLAIESLKNLGITQEEAQGVVEKIQEYTSETPVEEALEEEHKDGRAEEEEAPQVERSSDGKIDLIDWLMGKKIIGKDFSSEDLVQAIVSSEVPAPMLMDLVMSKTLDEVCSIGFKGSPTPLWIGNMMICMMALGRKARLEGIELFSVAGEVANEERAGEVTY